MQTPVLIYMCGRAASSRPACDTDVWKCARCLHYRPDVSRKPEIDRDTPPSSVENTSLNVQTSAGKREYDRCRCPGCRLIVCTAAAESRSLQMQIGWILTEGRESTQPSFAMQCLLAIYPSNHSHRRALSDQCCSCSQNIRCTDEDLFLMFFISVLFYDLHIKPFHGHGRKLLALFFLYESYPSCQNKLRQTLF